MDLPILLPVLEPAYEVPSDIVAWNIFKTDPFSKKVHRRRVGPYRAILNIPAAISRNEPSALAENERS